MCILNFSNPDLLLTSVRVCHFQPLFGCNLKNTSKPGARQCWEYCWYHFGIHDALTHLVLPPCFAIIYAIYAIQVESFPQDFFECYGGPFGFVLFSALMLGVTASVVSEVREMCKEGFLVYVTNGSNIVDWLRISLFVAQFTMELLFSLKSSSLRDLFEVHTESSQAELEHSADAAFTATSSIRDALDIIVTINLLLHLAWIMKYFRHPKLAIVRNTISKSCMDLAHFMVVFLIVYAIFLVMANCLFGQDIKSYSSMGNTFITLFLILLGDFDYGEISQAFPLGAVLFFCSFILVMSFVMFNIILGIVCAAYDEASATNDGDDDESMFYEVRL